MMILLSFTSPGVRLVIVSPSLLAPVPPVMEMVTVGLKVKATPCSDSKVTAWAALTEKIAALKTTIPPLNINVKNDAKYVRLFITIIIHERFIFSNYFL